MERPIISIIYLQLMSSVTMFLLLKDTRTLLISTMRSESSV